MPRSSFHTFRVTPPLPATVAALVVCVAAAMAGASCSRQKADPRAPVASLAQTQEAQAAFQGIRSRWVFATPAERVTLEPRLVAFRARFPDDPLARVAHVYLAFIALHKGQLDEARVIARAVATGPAGNTRDLATLVQGALLVQAKQPEQALRVLEPLEGKLLDGFADDLLYEAIVEAAVQAQRWLPAAQYMNAWIRESDDTDRKAVRARIEASLRRFPWEALENTLQTIQRDPRVDAWDKDMRTAVALRLGQVAVERSDARLARSVIETSRTVGGLPNAGSELEELASLGARVPTVAGRAVGLVVPTANPRTRARAMDAIQGALEVLKPRYTAENAVLPVLRMHESGAELDDVITALDLLAEDGASIAIAGFDPESASAAAGWAEAESMPVVLLARPSRMPQGARFVFVLGEDEATLEASVAEAARTSAQGKIGRILPAGSAKADDAVACDATAPTAGDPRFPFRAWKADKVAAIAVAGGPSCATDVFQELWAMRWHPTVVLGLPSLGATMPQRDGGIVLQAVAGRLGAVRGTPLDNDSLAAWRGAHETMPGWFAALGRDAVVLASLAVGVLPMDETNDKRQVASRRALVQQALRVATATLWTTSEQGFAGGWQMKREIRYERVRGK